MIEGAISPDVLDEVIEQHIDAEEWKKLKRIEELERATYQCTIARFRKGRKR